MGMIRCVMFRCSQSWNWENIPLSITLTWTTGTVCLRSSDPFYIVTCYIKWVTTSWTDGTTLRRRSNDPFYQVTHYITWGTASRTHSEEEV